MIVSDDNRLLARTSWTELRVWDLSTLNQVASISGSYEFKAGQNFTIIPGTISTVAFSPDSKLIALTKQSGLSSGVAVHLHSTSDFESIRTIPLGSGTCIGTQFSADGKRLVSLFGQGSFGVTVGPGDLLVNDVTTGQKISKHEFDRDLLPVSCNWSPDGKWLAVNFRPQTPTSVSHDETHIFNAEDFTLYDKFNVGNPHHGLLFSPDSKSLLVPSIGTSTVGAVYSLAEKRILPNLSIDSFIGHSQLGQTSLFSKGRLLQAGSGKIRTLLWPGLTEGEEIVVGGFPIARLHLSPDETKVVVLTDDTHNIQSSLVFEGVPIQGARPRRSTTMAQRPSRALAVPNQIGIQTDDLRNEEIRFFDQFNSRVSPLSWDTMALPIIGFRDRSGVAIVLPNHGLTVWNRISDGADPKLRLAFMLPADCRAASCDLDGTRITYADGPKVMICNRQGEILELVGRHDQAVFALDWSADGHWLASAGHDNVVKIWNRETNELQSVFPTGSDELLCLRFTPDSKSIAFGTSQGWLAFGDPQVGEVKCRIQAHGAALRDLDFSKYGGLLVTGGSDGAVRYWWAASDTPWLSDRRPTLKNDEWNDSIVAAKLPPILRDQTQAESARSFIEAELTVHFAGDTKASTTSNIDAMLETGREVQIVAVRGTPVPKSDRTFQDFPVLDDAALRMIRGLPRLQSLEIVERQVTPSGWQRIVDLPALRNCIVRESQLAEVSLAGLAKSKDLKTLYLGNTAIGSDDWQILGNFPDLENLGFRAGNISSEQLEHLGSLSRLDLLILADATFPTDIRPLSRLSKLRVLDLRGSNLDDSSMDVIQSLNSLEWINLKNTKISIDGALALLRARPNIQIAVSSELGQGQWNKRALLFGAPLGENGSPIDLGSIQKSLEEGTPITSILFPRRNVGRMIYSAPQWITYHQFNTTERMHPIDWQNLGALEHLQHLYLGSIGDPEELETALQNKKLRSIIFEVAITSASLKSLAGQDELTRLNLYKPKLSASAYQHFRPLIKLADLRLASTGVRIPLLVQNCPGLKKLTLSDTKLDSGRLADLAQLRSLESLTIEGISIGESELKELGTILSLKKLQLRQTKVSSFDLSRFRKSHPKLNVTVR